MWCWSTGAARAESLPPTEERRLGVLIGPRKQSLAEVRAENRSLFANRAQWRAEPLGRLLGYQRLAHNYQWLQAADSAYHYLLLARREGLRPALTRRYPQEVAAVQDELATYHWAAFRLDSAVAYYEAEAALLVRAGFDLQTPNPVKMLTGETVVMGRKIAALYANAGIGYRRQGELLTAVRLYEQAAQLLQTHQALPGVCWVQCLLGEAYEDQGNDARALLYYEQAFGTVQAIARVNPTEAAGEFIDVLDYSHDVLLRRRAYPRLADLTRQAIALSLRVERLEPKLSAAAEHTAAAYLHQATLYQQTQPPDSLRAALARADAALARDRALDDDALNAYYQRLLLGLGLRMELAARMADQASQRRIQRAALDTLAQLQAVSNQAVARERLSASFIRAGAPTMATRLLRPLEAVYRTQSARLKLRELYRQLEAAYRGRGLTDSAYFYARRREALTDTLRAADQYAALAAAEARYRTREQARQISALTERAARQRRERQLVFVGVLLLAVLLAGAVVALRYTRRLNRRLAELDQLKNQFFANVSHELRTPLTLVVGPVEHVLQHPENLPPDVVRQLDLTLRNGQRLQQLVNDLLDLTKLEAGRLEVRAAPERLVVRLQQLMDAFDALARYRQVTLVLRHQLPADLTLRFDAPKVDQILSNLLSNALKFTPPGGTVTLEAVTAGTNRWRLTVSDTGPGIAPDEQEKVFERFYQTRQRHAQGGTGIGLAFSRELANLLGGSLTLESRPGQGSAFTLTLPAEVVVTTEEAGTPLEATPDEDDSAPPPIALPHTDRPRVLVVEDNADLRAYLRQLLEARYEVLTVEDGQAALELLSRESVDLISSDEMMPRLSGTELLLSLKAQASWQRVPFLMLTARADAQHRFRALELGVDDYLQKPFAPRELLARVHNLLVNYRERLAFRQYETAPEQEVPGRAPTSSEAMIPEKAAIATAPQAAGAPLNLPLAEEMPTEADSALLARLREVTEAALAEPAFDVLQLCIQLDLSERTLYRKLKELTGLTPAAYVREVRLERARFLLETRAMSTVADVAFAVGFEDPSYFGKVFLKRYGKRPGEYL